jgi:hypothetical protein
MLQHSEKVRHLKPKVLAIVEQNNGKYTIDALARKLQELQEKVTFDELDEVISELRGPSSIKRNMDGKLEYIAPFNELPIPN